MRLCGNVSHIRSPRPAAEYGGCACGRAALKLPRTHGFGGEKHTLSEMLGVLIFDKLSLLVWLGSKDGARGKNRPESLAAKLFGTPNEPQTEGFDDPMAYEKARQKILDGGD